MKFILALCSLFWIGGLTLSQTTPAKPKTFELKIPLTKSNFQTPAVNVKAELKKDALERGDGFLKAFKFGKEFTVQIDVFDQGEKTLLANGDIVYQFGIRCNTARSINLIFDQFHLAPGVNLFIINPNNKTSEGAYTDKNNNAGNMLGTDLTKSTEIIVEVDVPYAQIGHSTLKIGSIIHGYQSTEKFGKSINDSGDCNIDVNCPLGQGWENQRNSVGMIISGSAKCSGSLVNNTSGNIIPYFLTANHCATIQPSWVFKFRYETPADQVDCATAAPSNDGPTYMNINGGSLVAKNKESDFQLILLNANPDPTWGVYYNGWDKTDSLTVTQGTGIHHPQGDVKKISRIDDVLIHVTDKIAGFDSTRLWQVASWDFGVTEKMSSGSPLFDQNKRVIGVLSGGEAACLDDVNNGLDDNYGRFGVAWDSGTNSSERLMDWLDPGNINPPFIEGRNPSISPFTTDAGVSNIQGAVQLICEDSVRPRFYLNNNGSDPLLSVVIQYGYDENITKVYNWTGNLAQYGVETIYLPVLLGITDAHTFSATLTSPNGLADENALNDSTASTLKLVCPSETLSLDLSIDCYGTETTWELVDGSNQVVYTGGPYMEKLDLCAVHEHFCVSTGCYTFTLYDSFGNGLNSATCDTGSYILKNSSGTILAELTKEQAAFGTSVDRNFCVTADTLFLTPETNLVVYPNPANEVLKVQTAGELISSIELYALTGQLLLKQKPNQSTVEINVEPYQNGIYMLKILTSKGVTTKQIVIHAAN
jgi:lysyl endopeptidase